LADDFPATLAHQIDLGRSCCDYGKLLRDTGKEAESLAWLDKAIRTLGKVNQRDRWFRAAQPVLRDSHWNRAVALDQLDRHAESVKDWDRAVALSPAREQPDFRIRRAVSLVRGGEAAAAIAELVELRKAATVTAGQWYEFARIYALASGQVADKKKEYAESAIQMLQYSVQAGFKDAARMAKDKDLDQLRERGDFKRLLGNLD
jgi:tetratricopeptide (TPR) repeat protein